MWFKFPFASKTEALPLEQIQVGGAARALLIVRHPRARRYLLRLQPDGVVRLTVPRRGSLSAAREFASRQQAWLERQWERLQQLPRRPNGWFLGDEILLHGEKVLIEAVPDSITHIQFGGDILKVADVAADLKSAVQRHLWMMAARELPPLVFEKAAEHQLTVRRVTVRNQKSRWGSCSRRGTISLNWRLVQTPTFVRDYIVIHELMHLKQMNHSPKYWQEVERAFGNYQAAEKWLKGNGGLLR